MDISINGRVIAHLDEKALAGNRHIVPIPDDLADARVVDIEFKMAKAQGVNGDSRKLSVLFRYIGLEPADGF